MIEIEQAVYFIESRGLDPVIKFGIVRDLWEDNGFYHYAVDFLSIKEHRYIKGIDKVLRLLHDDTLAKEYRRILLSMANVDDIEIKKIGNIIYYRYFSKKEPYKMVQL